MWLHWHQVLPTSGDIALPTCIYTGLYVYVRRTAIYVALRTRSHRYMYMYMYILSLLNICTHLHVHVDVDVCTCTHVSCSCYGTAILCSSAQPLRELLSSVGGTSVMLGLVAMATSVDALYASMKALVCIVGNNQVALKEMERTGGFQVRAACVCVCMYGCVCVRAHVVHVCML